MATNLSDAVASLARQIATDQVAQDITIAATYATKSEVKPQSETTARLLTLEAKVTELIRVVWAESEVEPLSLSVKGEANESAFAVRLAALEEKVAELEDKTWKQEPL